MPFDTEIQPEIKFKIPSEIQLKIPLDIVFQTTSQNTMKVIAVYHNKGGVGKTTTVVNLAAALSKKGNKVLVIDLDSQANTTFATGLVKFEDEEQDDLKDSNILQVLQSEDFYSIAEVARKSNFCNPEIRCNSFPHRFNAIRNRTQSTRLQPNDFNSETSRSTG